MIKTEVVAPGVLKLTAPETLEADDFLDLAPAVDALISENGRIRLLVDATHVEGWGNIAALEKHAGFVRDHQERVERIAVIVRRDWQHWLVGAIKVFLNPEIRVFDPGREAEALAWLEKVRVKADGVAAPAVDGKVYAGLMGGPAR